MPAMLPPRARRRALARAAVSAISALSVAAAIAGPALHTAEGADLLVSSSGFGAVVRYDTATGASQTLVAPGSGGLVNADGVTVGPDGAVYVCSETGKRVLRFDRATGAYLGDFVAAGSGGLGQCEDLAFGPDGNLYVTNPESDANPRNDQVLRYDGATGAFRDVFVTTRSGGLHTPSGLVFGPGGDLFVASTNTSQILRYDGTTGAFRGIFVAAGSGGLSRPVGLAFGPAASGGDLFVSSLDTDQVLRYDGATGAFRSVFVASGAGGLRGAYDLAFGPDGDLYVASFVGNQVLRYDGATGALRSALGGGALLHPTYLAFAPAAPILPCAAGTQTLCLLGGRFAVAAAWSTDSGLSGAAQAVPLTGDTGYFWFFASSNVEAIVKVLDGCAVGGHYWVFAGGLTNVAVTTTVTDTRTGAVRVYQNPQDRPFAPLQDTAAFPCP
jgi:streptogramin lyase